MAVRPARLPVRRPLRTLPLLLASPPRRRRQNRPSASPTHPPFPSFKAALDVHQFRNQVCPRLCKVEGVSPVPPKSSHALLAVEGEHTQRGTVLP